MKKITPFFWFDREAEEASEFYTSLFENSKTGPVTRYTDEGKDVHGMSAGTVMTIGFTLAGQPFAALNGGPHFTFNPAISFFVICETENEIERLWNELGKNGQVLMPLDKYDWSEKYGWVQDRFGISWQLALGKIDDTGQKITPSLMFVGEQHGHAEEAIHYYTSVFPNSEIEGIARYDGSESTDPEGTVKHAQFTLDGETFMIMESALDHKFGFNEAISFVVYCKTADEVDFYWEKLSAGGDPNARQCGWLKDRFGVSWQVVPEALPEMLMDKDPEKVKRVTSALLKMKKLDVSKLQAAFHGKSDHVQANNP